MKPLMWDKMAAVLRSDVADSSLEIAGWQGHQIGFYEKKREKKGVDRKRRRERRMDKVKEEKIITKKRTRDRSG